MSYTSFAFLQYRSGLFLQAALSSKLSLLQLDLSCPLNRPCLHYFWPSACTKQFYMTEVRQLCDVYGNKYWMQVTSELRAVPVQHCLPCMSSRFLTWAFFWTFHSVEHFLVFIGTPFSIQNCSIVSKHHQYVLYPAFTYLVSKSWDLQAVNYACIFQPTFAQSDIFL